MYKTISKGWICLRPRKKKNADKRISLCENVIIDNPSEHFGNYHTLFQNTNPIHLELGSGKGSFISNLALENPAVNFIAFEKVKDVFLMSAEKLSSLHIQNAYAICDDASHLTSFFSAGEISRIYINFCDPWPKQKHQKRRLTNRSFLDIYRLLLPEDGSIFFKTDNRQLFEFSLNEFCAAEYHLRNITFDLHASSFQGNIMTEYEERFSSLGQPIYRLEAFVNKPVLTE